MARTVTDKRRAFRALHEKGTFLLPNPWVSAAPVFWNSWASRHWRRQAQATPGRPAGRIMP